MRLPQYFFETLFVPFETILIKESDGLRHYRAGDYLVEYGNSLDFLFYVAEGVIRHAACTEEGHEMLISFHGQGALFPVKCHAFHFSLEPFLSIQAVTDVSAYRISTERFTHLLASTPSLAVTAIDYLTIYSNLHIARQFLQNHNTVANRVCSFLYIYCHNRPACGNQIELSQAEVAAVTAVSPVQVARTYRLLRKQGIITTKKGSVRIMDIGQLKKYCSEMILYEDRIDAKGLAMTGLDTLENSRLREEIHRFHESQIPDDYKEKR